MVYVAPWDRKEENNIGSSAIPSAQQMQQQQYVAPWDRQPKEQIQETRLSVPETIELPDKKVGMIQAVKDIASNIFSNKSDATGVSQGIGPTLDIGKTISEKKLREQNILTSDIKDKEGAALRATPVVSPTLDIGKVSSAQKQAEFERSILSGEASKATFNEMFAKNPIVAPVLEGIEADLDAGKRLSPEDAYMARTFGIIKSADNTGNRFMSNIRAGTGGLAASMGGALKRFGAKEIGEELQRRGETTAATWAQANPTLLDDVIQSLPFTLSLMPTMLIGGGIGVGLGSRLGLNTLGKSILGSFTSAGMSRPLESILEAGGAYNEALGRDFNVAKAEKVFNEVFSKNMLLGFMDFSEILLSFTPWGRIAVKSPAAKAILKGGGKAGDVTRLISKLGLVGVQEGMEEVFQEKFETEALGDEFDWTGAETVRAGTVGAIYGIGMGAAGAAFHGLNNSIMNRMKAQQIESFNVLTDHYKNQGMTDELAVLKALNGLAETEEGKNIIKAALPEAIESFNAGAAEVALTDELLPQKEEALSSGEVLQDERVKSDEKLTEAAATIPTEAAVQKTESKEAQQEEIDIDDIIELQAETGAVADINAGERYRLKNLGEVEVIDASDPSRVIVKNRHGNEIVLNRKIFEGLQQETLQRAHSSDFDVQQEQPYNKGKDITDKVGVKDVAGIQKRGQVSIEKILLDLEKSVSQRISSKLPDGTRVYELVADETKGKKEARDLQAARQIAELFGHQFAHIRVNPELKNSNPEAYDLANSFNGANIDGTIVINADRTNPAHAVVGHEITHEIAKDKELYEDFIGIIKGLTTEKGHDAVQGLIDAYKESGLAISEEQAWEEFAGDFVAEQMTKKDFWDKLAARSPSVAQKAIDVIKKIIAYIRRSIAPGDTVSQFIRDLELAQDIAVDAVARYLDKSTLSKAESLMANADKSFLAEVSRKGTTLATVISNTQDSINNKINETVDLLKEDIRRGEPGKRIMVDEKGTNEAYSSKWVGIPSTHAKWYRDFWAMYKRKPSNKNLKEIALDWLRNGVASDETFSSQGQEIPADGEFLELEAFLSELQRIDDALAKGYESAEAANEAANIKDVKRDKGDAGYSADIRYSAKRKAAGETSEGTTKEGTTGQQLSFDFNSDMGRKVEQLEFNFPEIRGKEATKNAAKAIVEIEQQQKAQSDISAATTGREADHHESERVRSSDIRTVARGYTKRLLNNGGINLIGEKIKSPEELAVMAQVLRDPRFETFRMFFTKTLPGGSKEIVYHTGVTSRVPGASRAHLGDTPSKRAKYMVDVLTYAINSGADGYYFMHNHPSGDPKPSRGDITVTRIEAGRITPRLKYEGHIIINSNKYAYMGPNDISSGRYEIYELKGLGKDKLLSPDVPHPMLGIIPANDKGVITPQAIFGLASQYKAKDGYSVLYYMAPNFRIKGIQEILSTNIADIDNFKAWLREQAVDFGGHHVILIAEDLHTYKKAAQLIKEGYLVDVISIENGHSAQEQGRVAPPPDDDNIWMGEKLEAVATWEREGTWSSENPDIRFQLKKVAPKEVNSPAFKKWFGDSIVTIDGKPGNEPLVVYHNTNKEFSIFDISKARQSQDIPGFFFSSNKTDFKDMGNKQIQAYLSIQNPYTGNYANYKGIKGASTDSAFKEIRNALIEDGYDGIITKDDDSTEYIVFNPNQIKSVDNQGTWDSSNPDIRYQLKVEGGRWTQAGTKTESVEAKTAATKETSKTAAPDPFAGETPPSQKLGIVDSRFNSNVKLRGKKEISFDSHAFQNEDVEAEYRRSYGVTKRTLSQKAKEGATEFWHMFTRQMRKIDPKDSKNAVFIKEMTLYPKMMQMSGDYANRMIYKYIKDLGKKRFNIFRRTVLLKDLMEEVSLGHELPGEWTSEIVQDELARIQPKIDHLIQEAIDKRIAGNKKIVDDFLEAMKGIGVNLDSKFTRENYFRHQVLYFMDIQEYHAAGSGQKVRGKTSYGWLKERKGSKLSINTNYLEAESEVLSQMKYQTELAKMLKRLDNAYNIKDECVKEAKKATEQLQADSPDAKPVSWKKMIPEGYRIWQPIEGRHFYMVNTIPDKLAEELASGVLSEIGISQEDVSKVLAVGQKKKEYVLPEEIADTLDHIDSMQPDNVVFQVIKDTLSVWKGWHLTDNPRSMIKYNIRNVSGDLDGTLGAIGFGAVKPQLINRAVRELYDAMWHMNFSRDMQEWWEAGGFQTLLYAQEIGDVSHLKPFRRLEDAKGLLDKAARVPMTYLEFARDVTNYREGILRYSAYLFYKDHLKKNGGKPKFYGASIPATVDGLTTIKDKAFQLSNDALGAYDQITEFGRILRQYLIPFHSWNEVNFKRYKRIFANIMTNESLQKNAGEKFARTLGLSAAISARTAMLLGRVVLRASLFAAMLTMWNGLWPEEEDDLPKEVRNKPHIVLGRNKDGDVIYFSRLGALVDLLDWVGIDTLQSDLQEIKEGKKDMGEQVEDMFYSIPDNIVSSLTPFLKTPLEIISGQTYFPEVRTPRKIRDKGEYVAQSMNLVEEYRRLAGKPVKYSYADSWARAVIYKASPSESAYYYSMDLKRKFEEKVQGKVPSSGFSDTPRSKALYYFKQSLKFKEPDKAYRYISDYFANGGTAKGIVLSLQTMDPLYGLDKKEQQQYYDWLTEKDRKKVKDGLRYYHDTVQYNPRNKAEKKIYGHIENVLLSNAPEEIKEKEMMNVIKAMMD